jgi:hypothetical protein
MNNDKDLATIRTYLHCSKRHEQHIDHLIQLNMLESWLHKGVGYDSPLNIDEHQMDDQYGMRNRYSRSLDQSIVHLHRNVDTT